jgi:hypothetical protein
MKRLIRTATLVALAFAMNLQASAREVVAFRDGRYLEIRTHKQYHPYILLEVTPNAYVICPASTIVTIERDGRVVFQADRRRDEVRPTSGELRAATPQKLRPTRAY